MSGKQTKFWAVILAGGDGRRLEALTTTADGLSTPKQFCSLSGGPSLLQLALQRAVGLVPRERIVPVVTESHRRWWEPALVSLRRSPVVVQPSNRGTGLGVLLPLLVIAKSDPDATVICIPSDHHVEHEEVFAESMRQATAPEVFDGDKLTLLGISPNAPDSGFGYLSPCPNSGVGMRPVLKFVEKPAEATAARLIRSGAVWSSGIVAGRISQIVDLYSRQVPGLTPDLKAVVHQWPDSRIPSAELASFYARHAAIDFSSDVLQGHPNRLQFLTVPPCGWNDVGTPARLAMTLWSLRSPFHKSDSLSAATPLNLASAFNRASMQTPVAPQALLSMSCTGRQPTPRNPPLLAGTAWNAGYDE